MKAYVLRESVISRLPCFNSQVWRILKGGKIVSEDYMLEAKECYKYKSSAEKAAKKMEDEKYIYYDKYFIYKVEAMEVEVAQ